MTRSVPSTRFAMTSALVMAFASACGHSSKTLDAYESSKTLGVVTIPEPTTPSPSATGPNPTPAGAQYDCSAPASQQFDPTYMQAYSVSADVTKDVDDTLNLMSQDAKANQLLGVDGAAKDWQDIERSPDVDVPGVGVIRGYNYRDAGRGVNLDAGQKNRPSDGKNYATVFPTASARAASWDIDLEMRIGMAAGDETAASMNNMLLAPCMNIIRHPYWGRTQETYSEDSYHTGRMATAYTVGLQKYVTGCAKHFAANNIERFRSTQNAIMNEQTLREIYGRHFEMVVQDGGIGCIMASYNKINGVKSTQNAHLLRDILKAPVEQGGMGFKGLVISDWWAMPGDQKAPDAATAQTLTTEAVAAGLDIEVPWTLHYSTSTLAQADQELVKDAARRILEQKFRFKSAKDTDGWSITPPTSTMDGSSIAANADHEALTEEAEIKSAVLLTNGLMSAPPVLPLTAATNIAVIGLDQDFSLISSSVPKSCGGDGGTTAQGQKAVRSCTFHHATDPNLGDRGSSRVNGDPARSVGPFDGIKAEAGAITVTNGKSAADAANADTIVVVVGYTPGDEGEEYAIATGGDRSSLNLPAGQNELIGSVLDLMKPTIIIIQAGSIVNLPWLSHANVNQATIWAGYPGLRGGAALGKLIFGKANFSGKMPMAWPTEDQLQQFKDPDEAVLDTQMGYFFGYREYDRRKYVANMPVNLVFPFGHGLSYSTFEYSNLKLPDCPTVGKDGIVDITVDVKNTSMVNGEEVVMLFVKPPPKPANYTGDRPWKELKSFAKVKVDAMGMATAHLPLRIRDLRRWEGDTTGKWVVDSGTYTIAVGKDAEDAETSTTQGPLTVMGD